MPMYCFDLNTPVNLRLDEIQSDEFVYFKMPDSDEKDFKSSLETILAALSKKTSRLFFSESNSVDAQFINQLCNKYSVTWLGVKIPVKTAGESFKLFSMVAQKNSIPEFEYSGNSELFISTILHFFEQLNLPFAFISVQGPPDAEQVLLYRSIFSSLRKSGFTQKLYFSFNNLFLDEWNIKTHNTFSGLNTVHIDLSNKCTHSCVFCGIWGPDFIDEVKSKSNGALSADDINFMNRQMPPERAVEILNSLPETVQKVQFGGAGDPLTHPQWLDIITRWRARGFSIEVLSNFEYPDFEQIEVLHKLTNNKRNFSFLINVSAATHETYKAVRPRQSKAVFEKVLENIKFAHSLRVRDGHGLSLTILNIINSQNYKEAIQMVELAHSLGVGLWLKPLEIHSPLHLKYAIPESEKNNYDEIMAKAAARAAQLKVEISFADQVTENTFENNHDLYKKIPCTIGFTYARFEVDGTVRPCCISPSSMGNIFKDKLDHIWNSDQYENWRGKFLSIHKTHFHETESEYNYCKMCPHVPLNQNSAELLSRSRNK
jgi:MoaA/NifB/PqqE/SkfB family radical SAM enzyme